MRSYTIVASVALLAGSCSAAAAAESAHQQAPFLGLDALQRPTLHSSRRATLNVSQTFGHGQSQKKLHYSYDVTHPATAKVIKLAELGEDLAAVVCSPDGLSLAFTSAEAADTFHAELLDISRSTTATEADRIVVTGGPEWKCAKRQADHQQSGSPQQHVNPYVSPHGIILRKASADALAQSLTHSRTDSDGVELATVSFATEEAGYHDVFEHASIRFRTSAFPENSFHQHDHAHEQKEQQEQPQVVSESSLEPADGDDGLRGTTHRRKLGFLADFWSGATKVVSSVVTVGEKVVGAIVDTAEAIGTVANLVVTGDLSLDKSYTLDSFGWNYNSATQGAKTATTTISSTVVCNNCYAHAELDLLFDFDIASYKVSYFKVSALGSFKSNVEFELSDSYTRTWNYNKTVATVTLDTILLDIFGVPVSIDISAPIIVGATATVTANIDAAASASASGSIEYGIQYDGSNLHTISDKSLTYEGGLDSLSAEATLVASAYVMPVITVIVECIGGPTVSLKPHVDLQVSGAVDETIITLLEDALDTNIAIAAGSASVGSGSGSSSGSGSGSGGTSSSSYSTSYTSYSGAYYLSYYSYYSQPYEGSTCSWWSCSDYVGSQTGGGYGQTNCDVFCSASQPCTPSCADWGCSNCRRQLATTSSGTCSNGVQAALSWGFEVTVGATIDISIAGLSVGYKKDFPQTTVMSLSNPIASGCVSASDLLGRRGRKLSASAIAPSTGIQPGDLFAGEITYTGSGTKCASLFGGQRSSYLNMDVRVVNVLSTGTGDIIDVVATLNYAGASSSQTGGPFACISQRMYTWSTYSDGEGIMEVAQNQEGVEITQCTDGTAPNVGYYCSGFGSSAISCQDTTSCFSIVLRKSAGAGTGSSMTTLAPEGVTNAPANKCFGLGERTCLATDGCGWCIDNNYNSGCMSAPYASNLPWTTEYGDVLKNCDKGWEI